MPIFKKSFLNCLNPYDIRGIVSAELTEEFSYQIGRRFNSKNVIIARDGRESSLRLLNALKKGLLDSGNKVIEITDVSSSPLLYFSAIHLETDFAIMITGSHNSLEYNGFKFMKGNESFYGEELKSILNNQIKDQTGSYNYLDTRQEYIKKILHDIQINKNFKIAWECNNSGVGDILKSMNLKGEHILLNTTTDGNFIHIPPDPLVKENLNQIKQVILEQSCDFGFAFDGDGDRLVMINPNGEDLTSDQLIYLLALSLKKEERQKIIIDVKSSKTLIDELKNLGFEVVLTSGGHSIMKEKIIKESAVLAGEASGHFIINDSRYYPVDDALYIALRIIEYLQNNKLVELPLAPIKNEYKIPIAKKNKEIFIQNIQSNGREDELTLGGIRKNYIDGWWLIRASNTEDYILVKYESLNKAREELIKEELLNIMNIALSLI